MEQYVMKKSDLSMLSVLLPMRFDVSDAKDSRGIVYGRKESDYDTVIVLEPETGEECARLADLFAIERTGHDLVCWANSKREGLFEWGVADTGDTVHGSPQFLTEAPLSRTLFGAFDNLHSCEHATLLNTYRPLPSSLSGRSLIQLAPGEVAVMALALMDDGTYVATIEKLQDWDAGQSPFAGYGNARIVIVGLCGFAKDAPDVLNYMRGKEVFVSMHKEGPKVASEHYRSELENHTLRKLLLRVGTVAEHIGAKINAETESADGSRH